MSGALLVVSVLAGAGPAVGAFPGPKGKILFETNRGGNPEIYTMGPDGTGLMNITNHPAVDQFAAWSPDGTKIVFESDRDDGNRDVFVMNSNGSNPTRLTFSNVAVGSQLSLNGLSGIRPSRRKRELQTGQLAGRGKQSVSTACR